MIETLESVARLMRALMLGSNPPKTLDLLKEEARKGVTERELRILDSTPTMEAFFAVLAEAVFADKPYSAVADQDFVKRMDERVRAKFDAATQHVPEADKKPRRKAGEK